MNERKLISRLVSGAVVSVPDQSYITDCYKEMGKDGMFEFVRKKKIIPFAAKTFTRMGVETSYWKALLEEYRDRNKKVIRFLDRAYEVAAFNGVNKMFVSENFGAMLASGMDLGLFASGDVDNHAALEEKDKLYAAMNSLGCEIKERYAKNMIIAAEFFPPKQYGLPENFYMSVDFYPLARLKLPCFIDSEMFVDWEKMHCYEETHIKLAPDTALAYICMLHTSLHSFMRAPDHRLYIDLYNVFKLDVDYSLLATWCERDKTKTRAAVAGRISNTLMETQIPAIITDQGRSEKLFQMVCNQQEKYLYPEPGKLQVMKVDIMCDDSSDAHGVFEILFPDQNWMRKVFQETGISAYLSHWKRIF